MPMFGQTQSFALQPQGGFWTRFTAPYRPHRVAEVSFTDSPRIEKLMRGGAIYLSLRDAIALALENNLDLESARITPKLDLANLQRAAAGTLLRNVSSNVSNGPSSASLGVLSGASAVGTTGSSAGSSTGGVLSGLNVQLAGSAIPNLDPTLFVQGTAAHSTQIETTTIVTGTSALVSQYKALTYGISQSYWTGTTVQLGLSSTFGLSQNATTALFNPVDQASMSLSFTQNLLNGFGVAVNKRALHQAENSLRAAELPFKQQVIATVTNVVNLYWDLVSFNDDLKVDQQTVELDTQLFEDNKRRAELGAIAPIDIIQAEADLKASQQALVTQESQVIQQEMILKSVLTRSGFDNPAISAARIIPTDHIEIPAQDPVIPVQDLIAEAMANRPEVATNQINLENARLSMLGTKNNLLPTLQAFATLANNGQAGTVNSNALPIYNNQGQIIGYQPVNNFLVGGYGTALSQVFSRNFPNYSAGFSLNVPLRNRSAQADLITDELNYRQSQIQDKQLHNSIKLNVINSSTAVRLARAAYETSIAARKLSDETLAGTRRKYELGTSTILDVIIAQRDDTTRQLAEVDARRQYVDAKTNLRQIMGRILDDYNVSIDEAKAGVVAREPDAIPPTPNPGDANAAPKRSVGPGAVMKQQ